MKFIYGICNIYYSTVYISLCSAYIVMIELGKSCCFVHRVLAFRPLATVLGDDSIFTPDGCCNKQHKMIFTTHIDHSRSSFIALINKNLYRGLYYPRNS